MDPYRRRNQGQSRTIAGMEAQPMSPDATTTPAEERAGVNGAQDAQEEPTELGEARTVSIDGEPTAKESRAPRVQRNWAAIKRAWVQGEPVSDISRVHGIKPTTLYCKASRSKWPKRHDPVTGVPRRIVTEATLPAVRKAIEPAVQEQVTQLLPTISAEIRQELAAWFKGVVSTSKAIKEHIDYSLNRAHGRVEVEEIKSLSLSLASIDTTVRRTFGLDSPDSRNLGVLASCRASVECPVDRSAVAVEVVAQPSGDSAQGAQAGA